MKSVHYFALPLLPSAFWSTNKIWKRIASVKRANREPNKEESPVPPRNKRLGGGEKWGNLKKNTKT
jgi:hypothetical protein